MALSNCKKPEDIGLSVLPDDDLLYTAYDSATIVTTTIREDTLRADELSRIVFGSMKDADFGMTNVTYYGQVLLGSTPNLIADTSHGSSADSLVLSLVYSGFYGDTTPVRIHVNELTDNMYLDSAYYSNKTFAANDAVELEGTGAPYEILPTTNLIMGTDSAVTPQLRIKLSDALRDRIFQLNGQTEFANNDNWKSYFKGIKISVDPATANGGGIFYFNPVASETRMTLYYHEDTVAKSYAFTLAGGARLNHPEHDYTGSTVENLIDDSTASVNYIQALAGLKTKVSFPNLKHFTDSGSILINKAELVVTVVSDEPVIKPPPTSLLFLAKNSGGTYEFPIDYYERSYGGAYSSTTKTYIFGITRTIQRIIDGTTTDYGFTLNILGSMVSGNSAVISGGSSGMKLKLYYTKLH